jgi:sporulation protein YlmC with PRC-barrel domain
MAMVNVSTFFFSQIIGSKVLSSDGKTIGRLKDFTADSASMRPKIVAATVLCKNEPRTVDFSYFQFSNIKGKCVLICDQLIPANLEGTETIQLVRQLLDNQVVDMNKKKLVRVNDLKIALLNSGAYVAAVDAGLKGRLRRLGIAESVQRILKLFDVSIPNRLILWDDIEAIDFSRAGAELSNSISGLHRLHPSDMADIIEDMDHNTQVEVFSALDMKRAADVLG